MFDALYRRIGISIKQAKTVLPTAVLTIYGIEIDYVAMESRLPVDKLERLKLLLDSTCNRKRSVFVTFSLLLGV